MYACRRLVRSALGLIKLEMSIVNLFILSLDTYKVTRQQQVGQWELSRRERPYHMTKCILWHMRWKFNCLSVSGFLGTINKTLFSQLWVNILWVVGRNNSGGKSPTCHMCFFKNARINVTYTGCLYFPQVLTCWQRKKSINFYDKKVRGVVLRQYTLFYDWWTVGNHWEFESSIKFRTVVLPFIAWCFTKIVLRGLNFRLK